MATIKAFNALRFTPKAGEAGELVCPPYDIIGEHEREAFLKRSEHNVIRLELPRDGKDPYAQAAATLQNWREDGFLALDQSPGLYICEQSFELNGCHTSTMGLCCMVRLEEYENGAVLPHESTMLKPKADRFDLMCACGCNFSSIHSLYSDSTGEIFPLLREKAADSPLMEFTDYDGNLNKVWKISLPAEIEEITSLFADKKLYIADGHNRYETALSYRNHLRVKEGPEGREADYVMMTLTHMEHPGLNALPYHRVVRDIKGFDAEKLLEDCGRYFALQNVAPGGLQKALEQAGIDGKMAIGLCLPETAYLLCLRDGSAPNTPGGDSSMSDIDVTLLHNLILERFLGIGREKLANQKNLAYTPNALKAINAVANDGANCAFLLGSHKLEEIIGVADAGEKLPPKSTCFYPKINTGHLMAMLRE